MHSRSSIHCRRIFGRNVLGRSDAGLSGAGLSGAGLSGAGLSGAGLSGACVTGLRAGGLMWAASNTTRDAALIPVKARLLLIQHQYGVALCRLLDGGWEAPAVGGPA